MNLLLRSTLNHQFRTPSSLLRTRQYAVSRFPTKRAGTGRVRDRPIKPTTESHQPRSSGWTEAERSLDDSRIWQAAQRPPASDPEQGLIHLLAHNDVLVIERFGIHKTLPSLLLSIIRQLEMLNIFIGFEQANKYAIRGSAFLSAISKRSPTSSVQRVKLVKLLATSLKNLKGSSRFCQGKHLRPIGPFGLL